MPICTDVKGSVDPICPGWMKNEKKCGDDEALQVKHPCVGRVSVGGKSAGVSLLARRRSLRNSPFFSMSAWRGVFHAYMYTKDGRDLSPISSSTFPLHLLPTRNAAFPHLSSPIHLSSLISHSCTSRILYKPI